MRSSRSLLANPTVREAFAVGPDDPRIGEVPTALVVAADPHDPPAGAELIDWLQDRLKPYEIPTTIRVVEAIPKLRR